MVREIKNIPLRTGVLVILLSDAHCGDFKNRLDLYNKDLAGLIFNTKKTPWKTVEISHGKEIRGFRYTTVQSGSFRGEKNAKTI